MANPDYNKKLGEINREAIRHYFATHIGCTNVEASKALCLSVMCVGRHVARLRSEWVENQEPVS